MQRVKVGASRRQKRKRSNKVSTKQNQISEKKKKSRTNEKVECVLGMESTSDKMILK